MKYLFLLTIVCTIMILLYVNSFFLKDKNLFIPPPENVTEQFFKKIEAHRFKLALKDLSETSPYDFNSLRELQRRIEGRLGQYEVYDGRSRLTGESTALSNVELRGKSKTSWPVFRLVQENGLWKIERLVAY